ncbi:hypothetical protein CNR22_21840 [Sphingobacteriaceae bacterium]|nr:hypothetical protein CNR22_21840 [Sphingobacteriaceae bacterium]
MKHTSMKNLFIQICLCIALFSSLSAQDLGKVIIRNASPNYPGFIISLNGVRTSNEYSSTICFDYLEEKNYRVKLLQAGSANILSFMVSSAPNYVSKYILNKDNTGNYSLILESKVLITEQNQSPQPLPGAESFSPAPQANVVTAMLDADYNEMIKSVKKESLEGTKLEMAKTFFGNQHLSSAQVAGILKVFSLENSKLNFAKYAYSRTIDKSNYFKVYDVFSLSGSKKEMSEYIKNNP